MNDKKIKTCNGFQCRNRKVKPVEIMRNGKTFTLQLCDDCAARTKAPDFTVKASAWIAIVRTEKKAG